MEPERYDFVGCYVPLDLKIALQKEAERLTRKNTDMTTRGERRVITMSQIMIDSLTIYLKERGYEL
jgi:hypothetical protein